MTPDGRQQLEGLAVYWDRLAALGTLSGDESGRLRQCAEELRDRLALLLVEAQLQQVQENQEVTTRMDGLSTSSDASRTAAPDVAEGDRSMTANQGSNKPLRERALSYAIGLVRDRERVEAPANAEIVSAYAMELAGLFMEEVTRRPARAPVTPFEQAAQFLEQAIRLTRVNHLMPLNAEECVQMLRAKIADAPPHVQRLHDMSNTPPPVTPTEDQR